MNRAVLVCLSLSDSGAKCTVEKYGSSDSDKDIKKAKGIGRAAVAKMRHVDYLSQFAESKTNDAQLSLHSKSKACDYYD